MAAEAVMAKGSTMTTADVEPSLIDLIRELREAVGLSVAALPITPKEAWEQALDEVRALRQDRGFYLSSGTGLVIEDAVRKARNHAMSTCPDCKARLDGVLELLRLGR